MPLQTVIAPKGDKGRVFTASLISYLKADYLWSYGQTSTNAIRPVWAVFAGSEQEMRAFSANLLLGRAAVSKHFSSSKTFEFLKTAGYAYHQKKLGSTTLFSIYQPQLFRIDPGMIDPDVVSFFVLPPVSWVQAQTFDLEKSEAKLRRLLAPEKLNVPSYLVDQVFKDYDLQLRLCEGSLLLAYLDRRCHYPLPFDPIFGAQLAFKLEHYYRVLKRPEPWDSAKVYALNLEEANVLPGFCVCTSHKNLGEILSVEVRHWYGTV